MSAYVLAVEIAKCDHQAGRKFIRTFSSAIGITRVFEDIHGGAEASKTANFRASIGGFEVDGTLTVGDLLTVAKSSVNKTLKFTCTQSEKNSVDIDIGEVCNEATRRAINAFEVLMTKGRDFPDKKTSRFVLTISI